MKRVIAGLLTLCLLASMCPTGAFTMQTYADEYEEQSADVQTEAPASTEPAQQTQSDAPAATEAPQPEAETMPAAEETRPEAETLPEAEETQPETEPSAEQETEPTQQPDETEESAADAMEPTEELPLESEPQTEEPPELYRKIAVGETAELNAAAGDGGEWTNSNYDAVSLSIKKSGGVQTDSASVTGLAEGNAAVIYTIDGVSYRWFVAVVPAEAAEATEAAEETKAAEETEPTEAADETEPTETEEPSEAADPTEESEPAKATDPTEESVPAETEQPTDAADSIENDPLEDEAALSVEDPSIDTASLSSSAVTVDVGKTATVTGSNARSSCTYAQTWVSSDASIAAVTYTQSSGTSTCTITGVSAGTATITHTYCSSSRNHNSHSTATEEVTVTVNAVAITAMELADQGETFAGAVFQLVPAVTPAGASGTFVWTSSDESVLTVSENGMVNVLSAGTATVTVTDTDTNLSASLAITAREAVALTGISLTGVDTLPAFTSAQLTLTVEPEGGDVRSAVWESSNEEILTVDQSGNISAIATGNVDITVTVTGADGSVFTATHTVAATDAETSTDEAQFYYLVSPTADPASNTSGWGDMLGTGTVNVTSSEWKDDKNCFGISGRVVSWPEGYEGGVVPSTSTHWSTIFKAYQSSLSTQFGLTISESDVTAIILHPYKISQNNGTTPDKHVDCTVEIQLNGIYTATYYLSDAGETGYTWKAAASYRAADTDNNTTDPANFSAISGLDATKTVDGVFYTLDGWYTSASRSGSAVSFPYEVTSNVNFYAKYVAGYYVNYDLDGGNWSPAIRYRKNVGSVVAILSTVPTKEGYRFTGWTSTQISAAAIKAGSFTMPSNDVTLTAQWEAENYDILIHYVYADGKTAAEDYAETVTYGTEYDVASPAIPGYAADQTSVSGTMGSADVEVTVTYTECDAVEISYRASEGGSVSLDAESVKPATGTPQGSAATPDDDHYFVNWTDSQGNVVGDDNVFVPQKNADGIYEAEVYTANFAAKTVVNVSIEGNGWKGTYDAKIHVCSGYTIDGTLPEGVTITLKDDVTASVSRETVGTANMGLTADSFVVTCPENVKIVITKVTDGYVTVTARPITITAASAEKTYDGEALTDSGSEITEGTLVTGHSYSVTVSGSITDPGTEENVPSDAKILDGEEKDVTANYEVTYVKGTLTVKKVTSEIVITAASASKVYDGKPLTDSGYSYTEDILAEGDELTAVVEGSQTEAGTSDNVVTSYKVMRGSTDVTANYTFGESVKGTLTVTAQSITPGEEGYTGVEVDTPEDAVYDGEEHKWIPELTDKDGNPLTEGQDYEVSYDTEDFTDKGEITVIIEGTGNYSGTIKKNYRITAASIEVTTYSAKRTYNGQPLTASGKVSGIADGETYTLVLPASQTDAGICDNTYTIVWDGTAKESNYELTEETIGTLEVTKRTVVLTSETATKEYDETPLTRPNVTISGDGFIAGEVAEIKAVGTVTNVSEGTVENTIVYTTGSGYKAGNYNIRLEPGTLSITPAPLGKVTVTGNHANYSWQYGATVTVKGYTHDGASKLIEVALNKPGADTVSGNDLGHYEMGLKTEYFTAESPNYETVEVTVVDGYLDIETINVTVTVTVRGNSGTFTYDKKTHTVSGYTVVSAIANTGREMSMSFVNLQLVGDDSVTGKNVGTYHMGLTASDFKISSRYYRVVKVVVEDGTLRITPAKVQPTEPTTPTEPKETEPTTPTEPTEPKATEPKETTKPTEPKATEPKETTKPTEPKATEPKETTKPTEPKVTEPKETTKPTEPKATEPKETTKPTESKETEPKETTPVQTGAAEATEPAQTKPAGETAAGTEPEATKPDASAAQETEPEDTAEQEQAKPAWALVNLILAVLTALASVALLVGYCIGKKQSEEEKAENAAAGNETKLHGAWRAFSLIPAAGAVIAFILTENIRNPMILIDRWTVLMVIIALVQAAVMMLSKKSTKKADNL